MNIKKALVLLLFLVAIIGIIAPINATTELANSKTKIYSIEAKEKSIKYKITWNGNGGKIESEKTVSTSVKKGSKIGKLVTTPKRSGYTFKGWYSKKSNGIKITKNTKPRKSVTYYAQWTKKASSRVLTAEEKGLIGKYTYGGYSTGYWAYNTYTTDKWVSGGSMGVGIWFKSDGTYVKHSVFEGSTFTRGGSYIVETGNWNIPVKGTIRLTNSVEDVLYKDGTKTLFPHPGVKYDYAYVIEEENGKKGISMSKYGNDLSSSKNFYQKVS